MAAAKSRHEWKTSEERFLRKHYPDKGGVWCAEELGRKSAAAVVEKARSLRIKRAGRMPVIREGESSLLDDAIRAAYQQPRHSGAVPRMAKQYGVTQQWVAARAAKIGARQPRVGSWSDAEIALLRENAQATTAQIDRIFQAAGFKRSHYAIECAKRRHDVARADSEVHRLADVHRLFGVSRMTPRLWVRRGLLVPEPGTDENGEPALVSDLELARFILVHPAAVDLRKLEPNKEWLLDLLVRKGPLVGLGATPTRREQVLQLAAARPELKPRQLAELLEMDARNVSVVVSQLRKEGRLPENREAA